MNNSSAKRMGDIVSNLLEQRDDQSVSTQEAFRLRMLDQIRQIGKYRQAVLRKTGRLLTPDEAAIEWIERYAATFDRDSG